MCIPCSKTFNAVPWFLVCDLDLAGWPTKKIVLGFNFWIGGVTCCCYLHMVATGELCCLSDNSGPYCNCSIYERYRFKNLVLKFSDRLLDLTDLTVKTWICENITFLFTFVECLLTYANCTLSSGDITHTICFIIHHMEWKFMLDPILKSLHWQIYYGIVVYRHAWTAVQGKV